MDEFIQYLPELRIAYAHRTGPYGPGNLETMERIKEWARENGLLTRAAVLLGISQDDPRKVPPEHCRYDACIGVDEAFPIDPPMLDGRFDGGLYAIRRIPHTAEAVQKAWEEIVPALQKAGYRIDDKPALERYSGELLLRHECEICVPVLPQ
ncbi:GyrI-like domain-containing protein [Saccharibacillus sp. CPCC 101409]|uniref:AraC family transcriptional regulator n=1 Tax=Saccharibacillus sp. CPCC 101409 TaxID=3058041 RepID=UPI002672D7CE|nr:GyrI-like domain-containing protein [Saccharibacillus sp. CPCC 101409]MDO3408571.1 GyrI-like domain-containing protein [Saccharibacillus sp. CPCC 101409]